jgi:streptomycin 6-kinase
LAYELGTVRRKDGKDQEALDLMEKAFDKWEHRFKAGKLQPWDYSWFSSCARALGKRDYAMLIEESAPKENDNKLYDSGNLTQMGSDYGVTLKK